MSNATQYEYEERAFLTEGQFLSVKKDLERIAIHYEPDNKTSYFFVLPDKNISIAASPKKTAIKYKGGQLGLGNGFEEIEIPIPHSSLSDTIKLFTSLLKLAPQRSEQFRINYQLTDNVEVALKYTQTWGFHLEVEKTYKHSDNVKSEKLQAKQDLDTLARRLNVTYIDDAIMETSKKAWAEGEQFGEYSPEVFSEKYGSTFQK